MVPGRTEVPYDVLDAETGNLFGRFPTEAEALAFVRSLIEANGAAVTDTVLFGGRDDAGHVLPVETGASLARRPIAVPAVDRPVATPA